MEGNNPFNILNDFSENITLVRLMKLLGNVNHDWAVTALVNIIDD